MTDGHTSNYIRHLTNKVLNNYMMRTKLFSIVTDSTAKILVVFIKFLL